MPGQVYYIDAGKKLEILFHKVYFLQGRRQIAKDVPAVLLRIRTGVNGEQGVYVIRLWNINFRMGKKGKPSGVIQVHMG